MKIFSCILLLCFFAFSACSKETSDHSSWQGQYVYEADSGETVGGDSAAVTYSLRLDAGKCLLEAKGYQTDETIICEHVTAGEKVLVKFVSYADGALTNAYGVEIYHPTELLFSLEAHEKTLETEWHALKPVETSSNTCLCFAKASR